MIRLTAVIELEGQTRALAHESNARSIILGRDAEADFQIPLTTISRQHSRISETDSVYVLEDLGSTHGTVVNGKRLTKGEKTVLRDGDVIELTKAKITCNIEHEKVVFADPNEGTQAIAAKAVEGILGRLGESNSDGPYLRALNGPDEGHRFGLGGNYSEWHMGRAKDCEVVLNDPNVSRRHATLRKNWNGYFISDLGSKNGVVVNGRKIGKPKLLRDGDEVQVGPLKLVFIDPDAELMAALSDVPGFAVDEAEEELESELEQVVPEASEEEVASGEADDSIGHQVDEAEDEELEDIDPELLEDPTGRFPFEWVIVGLAGLVIVGGVFGLVWLL